MVDLNNDETYVIHGDLIPLLALREGLIVACINTILYALTTPAIS